MAGSDVYTKNLFLLWFSFGKMVHNLLTIQTLPLQMCWNRREDKKTEILFSLHNQMTGFKWWETLTDRPPGYHSCLPCGSCRGSNSVWPVLFQTRKELRENQPTHNRTTITQRPVQLRNTTSLGNKHICGMSTQKRKLQNRNKKKISVFIKAFAGTCVLLHSDLCFRGIAHDF